MPTYKSKNGESWFRTLPAYGNSVKKVDRENRIIYGVSVCTAGEARGHGVMLDEDFISDCVKYGNAWKNGVKSRFGHPSISAESLGTAVGKFKNFYLDGKQAKADIYFYKEVKGAEHNIEYIMDMAEEDPKSFATSIVFKRGTEYKKSKSGEKIYEYDKNGDFNPRFDETSGDIYASMEKLMAVDFVDEPAANPNGLYSEDNLAAIAYNFLQENPKIYSVLQKNPNKLMDYIKTYTGLQSNTEDNMPDSAELNAEFEQFKSDKAAEILKLSEQIATFKTAIEGKDAEILKLSNEITEIKKANKDALIASFVNKLPEDAEKREAVKVKLEKLSEKLEGAEFSEMAELIIKENDKRIKPANLQGEFKQIEENSPLKPTDWDKFIQETKNEIKK